MQDNLAAARHVSGDRGDQPAERVDVLVLLVLGEDVAVFGLERFDGIARVGDGGAVGALDQLRVDVEGVFVSDFADDGLDQVRDGNQPVDAARHFFDDQLLRRRLRPGIDLDFVAALAKQLNRLSDPAGGKNPELAVGHVLSRPTHQSTGGEAWGSSAKRDLLPNMKAAGLAAGG